MLGLALRFPHWRATSSGSSNLNSPWLPSHAIQAAFDCGSASNSSRNYSKPTVESPELVAIEPGSSPGPLYPLLPIRKQSSVAVELKTS
uniref:Uncharacterized protein n=1 Tax=Daphnia galeata TaxID=27404 RepID=A0A8J2WNX0_9CRUS|nr:unnamed protein product [Daphnia galeata]